MEIVPIDRLTKVWPEVEPWIDAAVKCNQGDENILDVFVQLARGVYMLWYEKGKFAAVSQISQFPRQSVLTVLYCGGRGLGDIKKGFRDGCQWAKARGIDVIRVWGREGWEKLLGLERISVVLQKQLQEEQ